MSKIPKNYSEFAEFLSRLEDKNAALEETGDAADELKPYKPKKTTKAVKKRE